jgi:hypothetical protein
MAVHDNVPQLKRAYIVEVSHAASSK